MSDPCTICLGAWHPSTGAEYGPRSRACASCVRDVWGMLLARMHGQSRRACFAFLDFVCPFCVRAVTFPNFYDHVL